MSFPFSDSFKKSSIYFLIFLVAACSAPAKLIKQQSSLINVTVNDSLKEDASIKQLIEPYKQDLEKEMSELLITSETVFEKAQPEGVLGNLIADIILEKGNEHYRPEDFKYADFCLLNNGGLRVSLPKGEITKGKIFELMPFENEIVIVTLSGEKVSELIHYIIAVGGQPVSGLQIKSMNQPNLQVLIEGVPFDKNKTYKVVTSDYLADGGDKLEFFKNAIKVETTGYKIRDAIIDYLTIENQKGNSLKPYPGGRLTNEQ
jgi:2',3'-cyclic-nucleotide 2'-phosphodiesterase (5'-nucleotidase family)